MTRTLLRLYRVTVATLAATIIAVAMVSVVVRLLLPDADGPRETLVAHISQALGVQVQVDRLSIRLRGLTPALSFTDAKLLTPTNRVSADALATNVPPSEGSPGDAPPKPSQLLLSAQRLDVDLDLLATLRARQPRIEAISLVGAEIQVLRDANGQIRILGLDSMQGNDSQALDFFLREGRFRLLDSRLIWRDQQTKAPALTLFIKVAELANQDQRHALRLRAMREGSLAASPPAGDLAGSSAGNSAGALEILGQLNGQAQHPERWSGHLYLQVAGGDLGMIADRLPPLPIRLNAEGFRIESWNRLEQGRLVNGITRFKLQGLTLEAPASSKQVQFGDLAGLARWQQRARGWRLDLADLQLPGRPATKPTVASLAYRAAPSPSLTPSLTPTPAPLASLFATIGAFEIGPIVQAITLAIPDPSESVIALSRRQPRGLVRDLALHLAFTANAKASPEPHSSASGAIAQAEASPRGGGERAHQGNGRRPSAGTGTDWTAVAVDDWRLSADVENLSLAAGAPAEIRADRSAENAVENAAGTSARTSSGPNIPAFSGLNLGLDLGPRGGYAQVSGSAVQIDLRPLFARPHRFTGFDGDFAWRMMPGGSIHLWTQALSLDTKHLQTLSRLSLCLHPSGVNPFIDLHTHLGNGQIDALPSWLPVGIMDDRLEDWLQRAILDGQLESGDLLLRGPLDQFPFDDQQGRFILELRAVDGVLDYGVAAPSPSPATGLSNADNSPPLRWPLLQRIAATLRFENRGLEIHVPSAEILNSHIDAGRVSLPNLWQPTYLEIDARGAGPLADGLHLFATSPLAHQLGGLASAVEVSGDGDIQLQLGVPLNRALPFRYAGELIWRPQSETDIETSAGAEGSQARNASRVPGSPNTRLDQAPEGRGLRIRGTDLEFSQISGRLRFDATGIAAQGIRARLGQQALEVAVETRDGGSDDARTEISLRGRSGVDRLAEILPSNLWSFARGTLDWRLGLTLSNHDAAQQRPPIDFALSSDLRGIDLALPAPIGKPAQAQRRLQLTGRFQDQWPLRLRLDYGTLGSLIEVDRRSDGEIRLQRLAIDLNGQPSSLPPQRSIQIGGKLQRLELSPWLDWADQTDLKALQGNNTGTRLRLLPMQLQVADLRLGALQLNALDAVLTPEPSGAWNIGFSARQTGASQIDLPAISTDTSAGADTGLGAGANTNGKQPIRIRLEQLNLEPLAEAHGQSSAASTTAARVDPRRFGGLDLEIERLAYGDDLLGQLRIQSQPRTNGLRFTTLSLIGPHVDASGSGDWLIDATDYIASSLRISAKSNAVGELLRESGFYSALSGAPGQLQLDLSWPGGPSQLSLARARGTMEIEIGAGRLLEMEPGVGRMLGILNTAALGRRLSLDFSDVFDDGFSFDRITGEIAIGSGEASIRNLEMLAPPANIRITGHTNLVDGRLDQEVVVTPKIGVGLALASAVAGGPVVGAAVFLADKVTDGAVERLGRYAYQVTGPWRDPIIRRVDTGGSPSVGNLFVDEVPANESAGANAHAPRDTGAESKDATPADAVETSNPFLENL